MKARGSIWTPANIVTVTRVAFMPVWLAMAEFLKAKPDGFSIGAFIVGLGYVLICLTDKLDGYLARSRGEITAFGKFLDPIADKLAVTVALFFLLEVGDTNSWVVLIIVAREFLVSGLRMVVASQGVVVAASNLGKWKTATTMVALCGLLFARAFSPALWVGSALYLLSNILMGVAVVLTAWSGIDYFVKCWPYMSRAE